MSTASLLMSPPTLKLSKERKLKKAGKNKISEVRLEQQLLIKILKARLKMNEDDYQLDIGFVKILTIALAVIVLAIYLYAWSSLESNSPLMKVLMFFLPICMFLLLFIAYLIEKQEKKSPFFVVSLLLLSILAPCLIKSTKATEAGDLWYTHWGDFQDYRPTPENVSTTTTVSDVTGI